MNSDKLLRPEFRMETRTNNATATTMQENEVVVLELGLENEKRHHPNE